MFIVVEFNDPKAVGGGRNGGWLSALCRRERDCGLDFRLVVVQGWSRSLGLCLTAHGPNLLSGNLALVGSDGNKRKSCGKRSGCADS